jgi:hypothetical protein
MPRTTGIVLDAAVAKLVAVLVLALASLASSTAPGRALAVGAVDPVLVASGEEEEPVPDAGLGAWPVDKGGGSIATGRMAVSRLSLSLSGPMLLLRFRRPPTPRAAAASESAGRG